MPKKLTSEALHFLKPNELGGSYTDQQLRQMGFRQSSNGSWYIDQRAWQQIVNKQKAKDSTEVAVKSLLERVSSQLWHYTSIWSALQIMESGRIELTSLLGSRHEISLGVPRGYHYYLSTTRTTTGGYHGIVGSTGVLLELNGDWFNQRMPGHAVDYWQDRGYDPLKLSYRSHEAEDRVFSRSASIGLDAITAVHVLVTADTEPERRAIARRLVIAVKKRNIPVYVYDDKKTWRRTDRRHSVRPDYLKGPYMVRGRGSGHRGYLMPWMELIFGRNRDALSKRAQSILYSLAYHWDRGETVQGLSTDPIQCKKTRLWPGSWPGHKNYQLYDRPSSRQSRRFGSFRVQKMASRQTSASERSHPKHTVSCEPGCRHRFQRSPAVEEFGTTGIRS